MVEKVVKNVISIRTILKKKKKKKKKKNDNADPPYLVFPKLKPETHIYVWNYELILDTVAV